VIKIFGCFPEILEIVAIFSSSHHLTPRSADRLKLLHCSQFTSHTCWIILPVQHFKKKNSGAPLLGLAKSIYHSEISVSKKLLIKIYGKK